MPVSLAMHTVVGYTLRRTSVSCPARRLATARKASPTPMARKSALTKRTKRRS